MVKLAVTLLSLTALLNIVIAHATMKTPRERGALNVGEFGSFDIDGFPTDNCHHCNNGGGTGAVQKASNGTWTSWEPLNPAMPFRRDAGLCGDDVSSPKPRHHEKGGKYGPPASLPYSVVYKTGQVIEIEVAMSTNHLGHFTYFICDVGRCGGDVNEKCFHQGHCKKLIRAVEPECESATNKRCSPIDPKFPGRWYVPQGLMDTMKMKYQLPKGLVCKDCVLLWYWATANSCFDRGVQDYFKKYPSYNLKSQENMSLCGSSFPEEFWNCADVRVTGLGVPDPEIMPPTFDSDDDKDGDEKEEDELTLLNDEVSPVSAETMNSMLHAPEKAQSQSGIQHHHVPQPTDPPMIAPTVTPSPRRTERCHTGITNSPISSNSNHSSATASQVDNKKKAMKNGKMQNASGKCQAKWKQCGGKEYTGATNCCTGLQCAKLNDYYFQCKPK